MTENDPVSDRCINCIYLNDNHDRCSWCVQSMYSQFKTINDESRLEESKKCNPRQYMYQDHKLEESRPAATPEKTECRDPKARYYDAGGLEVLDVIKAKLKPEQYKGWLLGNLIKYSTRANFKDQFSRDIEKVNFYSKELFSILEK